MIANPLRSFRSIILFKAMTYSLLQNTDARHLTVTRHVSPQTSTLLSSLTMSLEQLTAQNRKLQARRLSFQVQPLTTMVGLSLLPPTLSSSPPSASRVTKREKPPTAHVTRMESKMCLLANDSGSRENVTPKRYPSYSSTLFFTHQAEGSVLLANHRLLNSVT